MARRRQKKRTHLPADTVKNAAASGVAQPLNASASRTPKTMVIRIGAGEVGPSVSQLVTDVRTMMEPHTASRLKERKSNKLKDYTTMAGPLGVTQLLLFSRNANSGSTTLRIARCPRGPTIHFRVKNYSLCKDIRKSLRNPKTPGKEFTTPPLLVMNGFNTPQPPKPDGTPARPPPHEMLLTSMFQSLFPPISAQRTPLSSIRRILLLNRQPKSEADEDSSEYVIDVRHYIITTKPVGLSRPIRRINAAEKTLRVKPSGERLIGSKKGALPNLSGLEDIAEYMLDPSAAAGGYTSESEIEEDAEVEVLPNGTRHTTKKKRAPRGPQKRAVKLSEVGPRMRLEMVKIEEGLADGKVLWHAWETKTKTEERELEVRHKVKKAEREKRTAIQMENIRKKKAEKAEKAAANKGKVKADGEEEEEEEDDDDDDEMWGEDEFEGENEDEGEKEAGEDKEMGEDE